MIGIFGGTFDPIHYGHLRPAAEVGQLLSLEKLFLVPASVPPHRQAPVATAEQRLQLMRLAVSEFPQMEVDDCEIRRGGISYTVDTLRHYRQLYPQTSLCLLLGSDAFASMQSWHQWRSLLTLAHLVVMQRPHHDDVVPEWSEARLIRHVDGLMNSASGKVYIQKVTPQDISATGIRQAIAAKNEFATLLPSRVLQYIQKYNIYE
ncbi:MAG: nicotinate-nucleotide adenylyltransferase [Acidiferrobacterales bacterium]